MINHLQTLLLNETQSSLESAGFPYGEPWLVSPRFATVEVPSGLSRLRDAIFDGTESLSDRINRVFSITPYLEAPDLDVARSYFDRRKTFDLESVHDIRSFFNGMKFSSGQFERSVLKAARGTSSLFLDEDDKKTMETLGILSNIARGAFESSLRVGASILAYCVKLDRISVR